MGSRQEPTDNRVRRPSETGGRAADPYSTPHDGGGKACLGGEAAKVRHVQHLSGISVFWAEQPHRLVLVKAGSISAISVGQFPQAFVNHVLVHVWHD